MLTATPKLDKALGKLIRVYAAVLLKGYGDECL